MRILDILRPPLVAIDVGTAMTRVSFGPAHVVEHPSLVREHVGDAVIARPVMRGGVVSDIAGVANVIRQLLDSRRRTLRRRPAAVVCAPTDVSANERDALVEAVVEGGASVVRVVPEPLAAAVGAGVDVASDYATAVVDIGDGVTDLAVFRAGAMIHSDATRIGCGTLRAAIHDFVELQQGLSALPEEMVEALVRGHCHDLALPRRFDVRVRRDDLETLLEPVIDAIASFIAAALHALPDGIAADAIDSGLHVTGGGANLPRLIRRIEERSGFRVMCARQPLLSVIRGAGAMLRDRHLLVD